MTINSAAIERVLHDSDQIKFTLLLQDGRPCKQIGFEELKSLAAGKSVCARWRGGKILSVQLIVPADQAFGRMGTVAREIREAFHGNAASQTVERAAETIPSYAKRHHAAHCSNWGGIVPAAWRAAIDRDCV